MGPRVKGVLVIVGPKLGQVIDWIWSSFEMEGCLRPQELQV